MSFVNKVLFNSQPNLLSHDSNVSNLIAVSSVGEGVILDFGWWILDELEGFHPEMVF
jgi:hypothetical protein